MTLPGHPAASRPLALIVEDSGDQVGLLTHHLERAGYDTFATADTESALAAFDTISPSVAVIDLLLPGISGQECARLVKERFPECFVIISSVLDETDYPPADAALPKPISGARLVAALPGRRA